MTQKVQHFGEKIKTNLKLVCEWWNRTDSNIHQNHTMENDGNTIRRQQGYQKKRFVHYGY